MSGQRASSRVVVVIVVVVVVVCVVVVAVVAVVVFDLFCTSCPKIALQDHILAAMITTEKSLPCLQEMVDNYLSEARVR